MSLPNARCLVSALVFSLTLCMTALPLQAIPARADVVGTTYTSPQYGYSMTWDESWAVIEEISVEVDRIMVTNGIGFVQLIGGDSYGQSPELAIVIEVGAMRADSHVSNVQELPASDGIPGSGGDESRYFKTISYTYTADDGSARDFTDYYEARTFSQGQAVLIFVGSAPSDIFSLAMTTFQPLLDSVVIPGQPVSSGGAPIPADLLKGEPAPVYMADQWRIGIAAAVQNTDIDGIGLAEKDGKEWVVVVADVTNWGATDASFPASDFFVQMQESSTKSKVATGSTSKAAGALGLPASPGDVTIKVGETARLVLVFQVKAGRTAPTLVYGSTELPLDDILGVTLTADALSEPAGPPDLQAATLVSTTDGTTIKVQYDGESKSHKIRLLGVDVPATNTPAVDEIMTYRGEPVWIETDPAVTTTGTPAVYLWAEDDDGNRVLINQVLIADGAATASTIPEEARFAAWLTQTGDQAAESNDGPEATPVSGAATPVASQRSTSFSNQ
jgi:endonuclease YncB( thermonuclease family)